MPRLIFVKTSNTSNVKENIHSTIGYRTRSIRNLISRNAYRTGEKNMMMAMGKYNISNYSIYSNNNNTTTSIAKSSDTQIVHDLNKSHSVQMNAQPSI